jgi:hypothetical protein
VRHARCLVPLSVALLAATAAWAEAPAASGRVHHSMKVTLDPARGWLTVEDVVTMPAGSSGPGRRESLGMTSGGPSE